MSTDYSTLERLPRKWTPEFVLWLQDNRIVSQRIETPYGTAEICENYVLEATPEELEQRRAHIQEVAARLAHRVRCQKTDV